MLGRICILTFCGALSFGADVCSGLPAGLSAFRPPVLTDEPHSTSLRLRVKSGGPEFRITLRPVVDSLDPGHSGDIEVARCEDAVLFQVLPVLEAGLPINFETAFWVSDINFDGYLDFSVVTAFGGRFGSYWSWVYDPPSGRFVQNELTEQLHRMGFLNQFSLGF